MASNGKSCDYDTLTIMVQYQTGLDMIGVGAAGQVYNVDDNIVLKACIIFQPPTSNCTERDLWYHASETVFNFGLLKDEKAVHRLLTQHPHPNIMEAINTTRPEGIYLRKYQPFPNGALPPQPDRIFFDIRISFERFFIFTALVLLTRIYARIIYSLTRTAVLYFVLSAPAAHLDILMLPGRRFFTESQRLS